jgi:hypothetical protein
MDHHVIHVCGQAIDRPGHICAFFSSPEEEYATLLPFFRDGVDHGEQVLNVVDDDLVAERRTALDVDGVRVGTDGATVLGCTEAYLIDGRFDMERMAGFVEQELAAARAKGRRVRTCGSMSWLRQRVPGSERAVEYEARMNLLVPKFDCTFMCAYQLDQLSGETIADIMATHPFVILKGEIRENKFYVPPERYLAELLNSRTKNAS